MKECPVCRRCFADEINHCPQDGDATIPTLSGETTLDGRYLLERRLGQGGMGVVFQARHIFLKTAHAIKIIIPEMVGNDAMLATRFRQEALAAAAIRHQNIIAVTDFGMVRGTMPFLVMEFVKGRSLQEILNAEGPMTPERAWELIGPIAAGVGAAHRQNIVHRDLKPLNIMVQESMPPAEGLKILDFGLAKIKSGELLGSFVQAQTSGLMGSPFYMAPEQWSDEEPDARADIYSLGIILYQMLAGEVPFKGSSIPSIMKKHLTLQPPSFHSMGVTVPPQIEAVVRHCLEKEVADRIDSIETFLKELRAATTATPVMVTQGRQTGPLDPNKTVVAESAPVDSKTNPPGFSATSVHTPGPGDTNFGASFESMPGTIDLAGEISQQVSEKAAALQREREAREAEAEAEKKREEDAADKQRKAQEERVAKEREHQEKLEKMALHAKELEERLERLSVSLSPASVIDPEVTHVQKGQTTSPGGFVPSQSVVSETKSKSPSMLIVIAAVVVLGLSGVGITAFVLLRPKQTTQVVNKPPVDKPTPDRLELIPIEGGTFYMGRNNGPAEERPAHLIQVPPFYMDKTEVTNAEYADFVRETNHPAPANWSSQKPPSGQEQWPVVNVSQEDAIDFAAWRSKRDRTNYRLPTEEEWEYAARNGDQDDLYPWGKDWQDGNAVVKDAAPAPVGTHSEGVNRWGVADLIGNVWEWTSSKVSSYPGNPIKIPTERRDLVTIRGGCYVSDPKRSETPVTSAMREFVPANTKTQLLGFRLVRTGH